MWDTELQLHLSLATEFHFFRDKKFVPSNYLASLLICKYRKAFTLAQFNVLSSAFLRGR